MESFTPSDDCTFVDIVADAGPTIFVALPHLFVTIFTLAIHLMGEVGIVQETSAYLLSVFPLTLTDIPMREAICDAALKFALKRPGSKYSSNGLFGRAAQIHVSQNVAVLKRDDALTLQVLGLTEVCRAGNGLGLQSCFRAW